MRLHPHSDLSDGEDEQDARVQKKARQDVQDDEDDMSGDRDGSGRMDFWFNDGDIVLAIETTLVRVHRRVLSRSPIWSDMLDIPQPIYVETYDGLPLVKLYGDTANDWISLLRWLYNDRAFYAAPPHFLATLGALRLSTKYDFPALRQWCITRLQHWWPPLPLIPSLPQSLPAPPHASAIALARETDVPEILPTAFYGLATLKWRTNADGGNAQEVLSPADLRRVMLGREGLQEMIDEFRRTLEDSDMHLSDPHRTCKAALVTRWRKAFSGSVAGSCVLRTLQEMMSENIHTACDGHLRWHRELAKERMEKVMEAVPKLFML